MSPADTHGPPLRHRVAEKRQPDMHFGSDCCRTERRWLSLGHSTESGVSAPLGAAASGGGNRNIGRKQ